MFCGLMNNSRWQNENIHNKTNKYSSERLFCGQVNKSRWQTKNIHNTTVINTAQKGIFCGQMNNPKWQTEKPCRRQSSVAGKEIVDTG